MILINKNNISGFTIVEVLLTLGIFVVIATMAMPSIGFWQNSANIKTASAEIKQALMLAREQSVGGKNNNKHGVYFDINLGKLSGLTVYQGESYSTRNTAYDFRLDWNANLTWLASKNINEINFSKNTGLPSATTTISLLDETIGEEKVVVVNELGIIE